MSAHPVWTTTSAAILTAVIAAGLASPALATETEQSTDLSVVGQANPALIEAITETTFTHGELRGEFGRISIKVHDTAAEGIALTKEDGAALAVQLPFANSAATARAAGTAAVTFDNRNGSSTVPVVTDDGSVAIHTIVEGSASPERYVYQLDIPHGTHIKQEKSGEVLILDAAGASVFFIAAPWARDANGRDVPTRYELHGSTLTQVVKHSSAFTYPVVADPSIGGFYMSKYQWNGVRNKLTLWPTFAGSTFSPWLVYTYGWPEVEGAVGNQNASMEEQFICHCAGNTVLAALGQTWDLETYRSVISNPWDMFFGPSPCNW